MHLRLALYELARRQQPNYHALPGLMQAAALDSEPADLATRLPRALAATGAAFIGLGLIFWIAANWGLWPRWAQFTLLQGLVCASLVGALGRATARAPLALLAMLGIGGSLAAFGQSYQTGADAWQLFALWAALALPLALGVRSDLLWAPWALVAMLALSLWIAEPSLRRWSYVPVSTPIYLVGWLVALAIAGLLLPAWRGVTGAGVWSLRLATALTVLMVGSSACAALLQREVSAVYGLGFLALGAVAASQWRRGLFDIFVASNVALALCTLLVGGATRLLLDANVSSWTAWLLVLGLLAAALLGIAVTLLMAGQRRSAAETATGEGEGEGA